MAAVGFAFNFNIQRCEVDVGDEEKIVRQGYSPLIELLLTYGVKSDFFFSGYSSRLIGDILPELLDMVKSNMPSPFELGTYTYTHPIPQLLAPRELEKQVEKGLAIDREIFGISPEGFLPPEFAYTGEMAKLLSTQGIRWTIVLASHLKRSAPDLPEKELHKPYLSIHEGFEMQVVPAVYQLPDTPERFFKLMMKGELSPETVIAGVERFARQNPGAILLFKRDAETLFIDELNSGFTGTRQVFTRFLDGLTRLDNIEFVTVGEFLKEHPPAGTVTLDDHLGNTKIETFTEGAARPVWDLTRNVREKLLTMEKKSPEDPRIPEAWEHLLLSHNSDGRIGYWHSRWNPGEHTVTPSRRKFIEDHLNKAQAILENGNE